MELEESLKSIPTFIPYLKSDKNENTDAKCNDANLPDRFEIDSMYCSEKCDRSPRIESLNFDNIFSEFAPIENVP